MIVAAATLGARAIARLREMKARHPLVGDVRGRGLLLGLDLVRDRESKAPAAEAAESVLYGALDRSLSFKVSMGSVINLSPPLTISEADLDRALDILEACIADEEGAR